MIELSQYHQGFVAGWLPSFFMGMGLMKMAWDYKDLRRFRGRHRLWAHFDHENLNLPMGPPPLKLGRTTPNPPPRSNDQQFHQEKP